MNKQLTRNIAYSLGLIVLVIIIILIRTRTPFGRDNTSFTPSAGREVTRIEMTSGSEKLNLEKGADGWLVNGKYEARKSAVSFISGVVTGMRIKSPVTPELFEKEVTERDVDPVKVRVFDGNRVVSSFFVYKTSSNIYGNIMKLSQRAKPYIMHLPGDEGNIGVIFTLNELYWQPFTIFSVLPSEIKSVTLENNTDNSCSFSLEAANNSYRLTDTQNSLTGWDTSRVKRYLTYFTHVPFENWATGLAPEMASGITSKTPMFILTVTRQDGTKTILSLWPKFKDDNTPDMDRLWARTNERDQLFIVRYFDIDPVLKKRSYFFQQ